MSPEHADVSGDIAKPANVSATSEMSREHSNVSETPAEHPKVSATSEMSPAHSNVSETSSNQLDTPKRKRKPKRLGPQTRSKFLRLIREGRDVVEASQECGFSRGRFYQLRLENEYFRDEWLAAEQEHLTDTRDVFLDTLASTGNVDQAAQAAGMNRRSLYKWRARDPEFDYEWKLALFEYDDAVVRGGMLQELAQGHQEQIIEQRPKKNAQGEVIGWEEEKRIAKRASRPADKLKYLQLHHPDFKTQISGPRGGPIPIAMEHRVRLEDDSDQFRKLLNFMDAESGDTVTAEYTDVGTVDDA